ncbi:NAD(P)/FAD-dependent oxidoreductase [Pelosinus sp. IPA-1]|uniref:NAD(P)/FAD-dependent oxidoreductase n=1 Tax=Pelosinus sp. IPA-1 TaxID=3029569 RepID=UPI0024362B71|nr:NAD(P)/FAD-dependent oxidoreductase [Pelosinus sp. IPA-1]GMA99250.1 aminoacetone oxidase family FAD-binding enzyme [Pelosinus sp. IPA-1]
MKKIIVIGAGPAGMMAAVSASQNGGKVTILEKMSVVGRKLSITGKGRCNITNIADKETIIKNMPGNGSFIYSALYSFSNQDIIDFLHSYGVMTKVERGGRVFPVSDQAKDVVEAFMKAFKELDIEVVTGQQVKRILTHDGKVTGVLANNNVQYRADAVILATGGASYPGTGSSGDGYRMGEMIGHTIVPLKPSLVPLEVGEDWIGDLQGLSLRNVSASVIFGGKKVADDFGEMLFTHYGLSGPIILSLSKKVAELLTNYPNQEVLIQINLKPALTAEVLDKRIQRDFEKFARKQLKNSLGELLPAKSIDVIIDLAHLDPDKFVHQITKGERARLVEQITKLTFTITATRPVSEAIVTAGGIHVKEINPKTMESKVVEGLYLAGEVIDIDGYTGGYNLQAAFSTGYVAGHNAAEM